MNPKLKLKAVVGLLAAFTLALGIGLGARLVADAGSNPDSTEAVLAAAIDGSEGAQAVALSDGVVSLHELNQAIGQAAQCARDRGVKIEMRAGSAKTPDRIGFAAATIDEGESFRRVLADCQQQYSSRLSAVFSAQVRPDAAQAAAGRDFIGQCMAGRGVVVAGAVSESVLIEWSMSPDPEIGGPYADCVDRHYRELGFWP